MLQKFVDSYCLDYSQLNVVDLTNSCQTILKNKITE